MRRQLARRLGLNRLHLTEGRPIVLNEERRRAMLELVTRNGRVLVPELARHFDTSQVTIRKDLEVLHNLRKLYRTHGGALPARDRALDDPTLREKEQLHGKEKLLIAEAAAQMVSSGQVMILDSGTTTTAIVRALRSLHDLTIITNAVNIAAELAGTSIEVILTGGTLRKNSFSLVGPIAKTRCGVLVPICFSWPWMGSTCLMV